MAKKIMIQGTCSNAGKSLVAAGLCRIFAQDGYKVCPFKAQNMALNSYITKDGLEMGRAQAVQAEACGIEPDVRMNPILLKPTSKQGSQAIIKGEVEGVYGAKDFHEKKKDFRQAVKDSFDSLSKEYDIIVIEGAGSPAEINLKKNDLANMGTAELVDAPVLLVGDIDRGGVFASLAGTMLLFDENERERVEGVIINKFRGDLDILKPGLDSLSDIINKPVLGVIPYTKVDIDDEDSLSEKLSSKKNRGLVDIAVIRLPRMSNFTDFNPLEYLDDVSVRYIDSKDSLGNPDIIIIPGTKNTMEDLIWMRENGIEAKVLKAASEDIPIIGICGGYQILGQVIKDPDGVEYGGELSGMKLLPHSTIFTGEKIRKSQTGVLSDVDGIFSDLSGKTYTGYEMHMGTSKADGNIINRGNVYGTYIHGIFDEEIITNVIIEAVMKKKGLDSKTIKAFDIKEYKESQYDILADVLRESLDIDYIYKVLR